MSSGNNWRIHDKFYRDVPTYFQYNSKLIGPSADRKSLGINVIFEIVNEDARPSQLVAYRFRRTRDGQGRIVSVEDPITYRINPGPTESPEPQLAQIVSQVLFDTAAEMCPELKLILAGYQAKVPVSTKKERVG